MHGIVLILDRARHVIISEMTQYLADNFGLFKPPVPPHCSLHVALDYDLDLAAKVTRKWASEVRSIPLTASGYGVFPSPEGMITYTTVAQTPRLTDLQVDLHRRLAAATREFHSLYHPERWVPHITFGTIPKESFPAAMGWLVEQPPYWTTISTEVALMEGKEDRFVRRVTAELNGSR